jgi:uncharacterized protein (TIGR00251 family)
MFYALSRFFYVILKKGAMITTLELKVIPQAGTQNIVQNIHGVIICKLKSPPEDGKANAELIKMLAKALSIPQAHIRIILGATNRKKTVAINDLDRTTILKRLGIEQQLSVST